MGQPDNERQNRREKYSSRNEEYGNFARSVSEQLNRARLSNDGSEPCPRDVPRVPRSRGEPRPRGEGFGYPGGEPHPRGEPRPRGEPHPRGEPRPRGEGFGYPRGGPRSPLIPGSDAALCPPPPPPPPERKDSEPRAYTAGKKAKAGEGNRIAVVSTVKALAESTKVADFCTFQVYSPLELSRQPQKGVVSVMMSKILDAALVTPSVDSPENSAAGSERTPRLVRDVLEEGFLIIPDWVLRADRAGSRRPKNKVPSAVLMYPTTEAAFLSDQLGCEARLKAFLDGDVRALVEQRVDVISAAATATAATSTQLKVEDFEFRLSRSMLFTFPNAFQLITGTVSSINREITLANQRKRMILQSGRRLLSDHAGHLLAIPVVLLQKGKIRGLQSYVAQCLRDSGILQKPDRPNPVFKVEIGHHLECTIDLYGKWNRKLKNQTPLDEAFRGLSLDSSKAASSVTASATSTAAAASSGIPSSKQKAGDEEVVAIITASFSCPSHDHDTRHVEVLVSLDLPGGKREMSEPVLDCAVRETEEETSILLDLTGTAAGGPHSVLSYEYIPNSSGVILIVDSAL